MFYKFFKILCRLWFGKILHTDVIGAENIPADGAFILAANHGIRLFSARSLTAKFVTWARKNFSKIP